jgi:hypothetical protein
LAEIKIILQLGKERTAKGLKYYVCTGGKHCFYMGHGVNSEGTEKGTRGKRDSIAVEWGGRGDRDGK